jgi:hypothetical protein
MRPGSSGRLVFQDDGTPVPARVRVREHARALVEAALGQEQRALEIALGSELPRNEALRLARSVLTRKVGPKK